MHIERTLQQRHRLTSVPGPVGVFRPVFAPIEMAEVLCQRSRGAPYIDDVARTKRNDVDAWSGFRDWHAPWLAARLEPHGVKKLSH